VWTLDFETGAIGGRPNYPPQPVGLAFRAPDGDKGYLAWGHPSGNNTDRAEATRFIKHIWRSGAPVLFFNAKFDLAVAYEKLGLSRLPWDRVHDAALLLFLADPHMRRQDLKGACEDILNWPAEERDAVAEWVWEHRKHLTSTYGGKVSRAKSGANSAGAWLSKVPGDIVAPYAVGDVDRTRALFDHLMPIISEYGMRPAYDRERRLLPILMENEEVGMRVATDRLGRDIETYTAAFERSETWLRRRLKSPGLNLDADQATAEALSRSGVVDDDKWTLTDSGQRSMKKDVLTPEMFNDVDVAAALGYRNRLATALKMFMLPWQEQAMARGGWISTNWSQTRGGDGGTRTGRPSTSRPNFLNISKDFETKKDGFVHPAFLDVPSLPLVRGYILPDADDHLFIHRDFDGQELRVFADFESGPLLAQYLRDPDTDPHAFVGQNLLQIVRSDFARQLLGDRTNVKIMNFQSIYGGGVSAAAAKLRCSYAEAKEFKAFHDKALPGRKILMEEIKRIVRAGDPIRTWGGRVYFPEEPKRVNGRMMDFEYKLINYLVQGSAADYTKQVLIDWYEHPQRDARFLVTVYDELNISAHKDVAREQNALLRDVMEAPRMSCPMRSSGKYGPDWGSLVKEKEKPL